MHTAYIGIGSNLGDRLSNCETGLSLLSLYRGIRIDRVSPWYETAEILVSRSAAPGPDYINGVARIETSLAPEELMARLAEAEARAGRPAHRTRGAPRTLDLDLLLYGQNVIDEAGLRVPHPEMAKRLFVLRPLCDIAPDAVDPRSGLAAWQLLEIVTKTSPEQSAHPVQMGIQQVAKGDNRC